MSDNASKPVYPDIERVSLTEALEELHSWVNNMDIDELAEQLSQSWRMEGKAVVIFDDQGGGDDSNPYCKGKAHRMVCIPVEEVKS